MWTQLALTFLAVAGGLTHADPIPASFSYFVNALNAYIKSPGLSFSYDFGDGVKDMSGKVQVVFFKSVEYSNEGTSSYEDKRCTLALKDVNLYIKRTDSTFVTFKECNLSVTYKSSNLTNMLTSHPTLLTLDNCQIQSSVPNQETQPFIWQNMLSQALYYGMTNGFSYQYKQSDITLQTLHDILGDVIYEATIEQPKTV